MNSKFIVNINTLGHLKAKLLVSGLCSGKMSPCVHANGHCSFIAQEKDSELKTPEIRICVPYRRSRPGVPVNS